MSVLLHEIEWSEPILPKVIISDWEQLVKKEMGTVPDILQRVSRNPWLRQLLLKWPRYKAWVLTPDLIDICSLVTAQENACRFCYGTVRAQMKFYGYSERMISNIERNIHLSEFNEKQRALIQFCRNLSRSNPRPPSSDRAELLRLGFSNVEIAELVFITGLGCFNNRVSTFISAPPLIFVERLAHSFIGKIFRSFIEKKLRKLEWSETRFLQGSPGSFPLVVDALRELPAATMLHEAMLGAFSSPVLSRNLKILMFAVVARTLECPFCEKEARKMAFDFGFTIEEFDQALMTLHSEKLTATELKILNWTRDTVRYQIGPMQKQIRELGAEIGEEKLLEAIGVAALANMVVRIAVLLG